jgi:hypothetical protein
MAASFTALQPKLGIAHGDLLYLAPPPCPNHREYSLISSHIYYSWSVLSLVYWMFHLESMGTDHRSGAELITLQISLLHRKKGFQNGSLAIPIGEPFCGKCFTLYSKKLYLEPKGSPMGTAEWQDSTFFFRFKIAPFFLRMYSNRRPRDGEVDRCACAHVCVCAYIPACTSLWDFGLVYILIFVCLSTIVVWLLVVVTAALDLPLEHRTLSGQRWV